MGRHKFSRGYNVKNEAIKLGVTEKDILIEDLSLHTKENVLASLLVLDRAFYLDNIKRLLVVTSYHIRRVNLTLKTYMPHWIKYTMCPVDDKTTRKDNLFQTEFGRKRVETESMKIVTSVKNRILVDEKIIVR